MLRLRLCFSIAIVAKGRVAGGGSIDVRVTAIDLGGYTICTDCIVVVLIAMVGSRRGWP